MRVKDRKVLRPKKERQKNNTNTHSAMIPCPTPYINSTRTLRIREGIHTNRHRDAGTLAHSQTHTHRDIQTHTQTKRDTETRCVTKTQMHRQKQRERA